MSPFHLALVWTPRIGVITFREQMFFRVAPLAIYETAGPLALIKFFICSVGWLLTPIGEAKFRFYLGWICDWFCHRVLARRREHWQFPRNAKARDAGASYMTFPGQCRQTWEWLTPSPVLQPLFLHLQCCRFILFEQSPWVNFLFASVCVLFMADTVPGQQL